ncbi:hypothetical protein TNCV_5141851 [Trichonephila clavipes]|nr:hypothetical protein TNCV_5141851 [Trichonephila clavipes]
MKEGLIASSYECPKCNDRHDVTWSAMKRFLRNCTSHAEYRRQEEEPMDWEDVPFFPEVSAPFVPSRPPRKMRSLISVQTEGVASLHSRGCPEGLLKRAASRDQSSRPPSSVPRATLFFERYFILSQQCQLSN